MNLYEPLPSADAMMREWRERDRHIETTGFVRITPELVDFLLQYGPYVEIGAGTGALSRAIDAAGGSSLATDNFQWHDGDWKSWSAAGVMRMDAVEAVELTMKEIGPERSILCSWPSYDENWCFRAVRHIKKGRLFVYIGEGRGGCTGCDRLHDLLAKEFEQIDSYWYPRFSGLHDRVKVYRRT